MNGVFKNAHRLRNICIANAEFMKAFIEVYTNFEGTTGDRQRQLQDMWTGFKENLSRINWIVTEIENDEFEED